MLFGIIFVCTGNTCRSPMAEAYFVALCQAHGIKHVDVQSAGFIGGSGRVSPEVPKVLREEGVFQCKRESSLLKAEHVQAADRIYVMTDNHVAEISARFPDAGTKTRKLLGTADVPDPVGGTYEDYVKCLEQMKPALERIASRFQKNLR